MIENSMASLSDLIVEANDASLGDHFGDGAVRQHAGFGGLVVRQEGELGAYHRLRGEAGRGRGGEGMTETRTSTGEERL